MGRDLIRRIHLPHTHRGRDRGTGCQVRPEKTPAGEGPGCTHSRGDGPGCLRGYLPPEDRVVRPSVARTEHCHAQGQIRICGGSVIIVPCGDASGSSEITTASVFGVQSSSSDEILADMLNVEQSKIIAEIQPLQMTLERFKKALEELTPHHLRIAIIEAVVLAEKRLEASRSSSLSQLMTSSQGTSSSSVSSSLECATDLAEKVKYMVTKKYKRLIFTFIDYQLYSPTGMSSSSSRDNSIPRHHHSNHHQQNSAETPPTTPRPLCGRGRHGPHSHQQHGRGLPGEPEAV